ncbi:MAG: hypothetical protein QOJ94_1574 [Sphingomonadales bacterium]|jgi:hypothetical protein|nr:hypothetical protein [Sphingomonadales bacterium]
MNVAIPPVRILERITRPAPFGIVFWDFATGAPVRDGLDISLTLLSRPALTISLIPNRNGVWVAARLPGRTDAELAATADWSTLRRPYRIEVADTAHRFLPLRLDAELPTGGLYEWPAWSHFPQGPLRPLSDALSPPHVSPGRIPLFSAPERKVAGPLAEVRCELLDAATGLPASWALVAASHDGAVRGLGLADRMGRATLLFPYPERERPSLSSPPAITDFRWPLDFAAFYDPPAGPVADMPDLAAILGQLDHPCDLFASTLSPPAPLGPRHLSFGRPLVLRTADTPDGPSSSLILERR